MNERYLQQAQRLQELRKRSSPQGRPEVSIQHVESGESSLSAGDAFGVNTPASSLHESEPVRDPLIYPGLYAPSGFDMMGILVRVRQRPNPTIDIGNIDSSVAVILCDSESPDVPIVYCSERFESLTGYSSPEILGRNCRFLQHPPTGQSVRLDASQEQEIRKTNGVARMVLRDKLPKDEEAQVKLVNFKKDGSVFVNILTVIPILWDDKDVKEKHGKKRKYLVGFQVDAQRGLFG